MQLIPHLCAFAAASLKDVTADWVSAGADIVTAVAAALGAGYFIRDRHGSPAIHFWTEVGPSFEADAVQVAVYAASYSATPAMLQRIASQPSAEFAVMEADYSLANVQRWIKSGRDRQSAPIWLKVSERPPILIPGFKPEGGYEPVTTLFVRRHARGGPARLTFLVQVVGRKGTIAKHTTVSLGDARPLDEIREALLN